VILKKCHEGAEETVADFARAHQQLRQAYQQRDHDLNLCRRIQQSLLPRTLPEMPPAHFAVSSHSCGRAGGDCYDLFRLDEDHIGFWLADVMGHGVTAGLLSIFLKTAACFKEVSGHDYRLLPPHEVLEQLNRDLLALPVVDNPIITLVYAVFDRRKSILSFARAGHPHPIHVPRGRDAKLCRSHGSLLGLFQTEFVTEALPLGSGDKLLLHTAGADWLAAEGKPSGAERLLALAAQYGSRPVQEFVDRLAHDLLEQARQPEDLTLLALEIRN
jgi:sigma-B regulation protein RsbU (phosphoserine phosphatase)